MIETVINHLKDKKGSYILWAIILMGAGFSTGSLGQQWLTQKIDSQINQKLVGIDTKIKRVESKVNDQTELLIAGQIRDTHERYCESPTTDRRDRIDELQQKHRHLTGSYYPLSPCG